MMKNVPVLQNKWQALVERSVREHTISSMQGTTLKEDDALEEEETGEEPTLQERRQATVTTFKKRRVYRQATGDEQPWFPHDNHFDLMKELVHESGASPRPKWVLHGTPAAGTGLGCPLMWPAWTWIGGCTRATPTR